MERKTLNIKIDNKQSNTGTFCGYASIFGNVDSHNDIVMPGAFGDEQYSTLIKLLWQHDKQCVIGEIKEVMEDDHGLFICAQLYLDNPQASGIFSMLKKGAVNSLSIGYQVLDYDIDSIGIRRIYKIKLHEISLVKYPSNPKSKVIEVKHITDREVIESIKSAINVLVLF